MSAINQEDLLKRLLDYVQIDSETGDEAAMAKRLVTDLNALGFTVTVDDVKEAAQTTGHNVYVTLPGDETLEPILFSSHIDTVMPGKGVKPQVDEDGYVRSDGSTVLGGDDKAGICAIIQAMIAAKDVPHRTVEAAFTVREESGMYGAKNLDYSRIQSKRCIVLDTGGGPDKLTTSAPGQNKIHATIIGKKAHAGVAPEEGISAIEVAAHAVAAMKLLRVDEETTCNIGTFSADGPTNIVTERVELMLECRSRNTEKLMKHTDHLVDCMKKACEQFGAKLEHTVTTSYLAFSLPEDHELVQSVMETVRKMDLTPKAVASGGGSDANIYNQKGIAAINIGVGMEKAHTTEEQLCIADMNAASELCLMMMKA